MASKKIKQIIVSAGDGATTYDGTLGEGVLPETVAYTDKPNVFKETQSLEKSLTLTNKAGVIKNTQFDPDAAENTRESMLLRLRDKDAKSAAGLDMFVGDNKQRSSALVVLNKSVQLGELAIKSNDGSKTFTVAPIPEYATAAETEIATVKTVKDVETKLSDRIEEVASSGGGSGGEVGYVVKPSITTPTTGAEGVSTKPNIVGSAYKNVFPDDARKHRRFQVAKDTAFSQGLKEKTVNADSHTLEEQLDAKTKYYARIRDVSTAGYESSWSDTVSFTTGEKIQVNPPTVTLKGYNDSTSDFVSGLKIECSEFSVSQGQSDTHKSTTYFIDKVSTGYSAEHVWESKDNTDNKTGITVPEGTLEKSTQYRVSVIYTGETFGASAPATKEFTTSADFGTVSAPTLEVQGGPSEVYETPELKGGAFSNTRDPDSHEMTDWKIEPTAGGPVVWESPNDKSNKTKIVVPKEKLQVSTSYKAKVRYKGTKYGWSAWTETQFSTVAEFPKGGVIGTVGEAGFGVGICPDSDVLTELNLSTMDGTDDPSSPNYGNYQHSTGVYVYIPAFCYKFGEAVNTYDIKSASEFDYDEEQMRAQGWILHRAFIDGGKVKHGFFIAKYIASRGTDGTAMIPQSVGDGKIIEISKTTSSFLNSEDMGGTGEGTDAIVLSKKIGPMYNCATGFMYAALAMISFYMGKKVKSTENCAWYDSDGTKNFPKGCNNNLRDINDMYVSYASDSSSYDYNRPLTGSGHPFAKTTHNGQECGVCDVNGCSRQIALGINCLNRSCKVFKESTSLSSVTSANIETEDLYEQVSYSKITRDTFFWGVSEQDSFIRDDTGPRRALCGLLPNENGCDRSGTNEFGQDHMQLNYDAVFFVAGYYRNEKEAGVFYRYCFGEWQYGGDSFRVAAYGSK